MDKQLHPIGELNQIVKRSLDII